MHFRRLITLLFCALLLPHPALAVLPPDILFSVGSQIGQVIAGIGAFIAGGIATLLPFMRRYGEGLRGARPALLAFGVLCILGASGFLFYLFTPETFTPPNPQGTTTPTTLSGHQFFAQRFVVLAHRANGDPVLIDVSANRKELPEGGFIHYYMGNIIDGTQTETFSVERTVPTADILPDLLFSTYQRTPASDHSAREEYTFTLPALGKTYTLATDALAADFLVKNEPEYTEYTGVGKAQLRVDGEILEAQVMAERIYSTDYRPTIFFEGSETLSSETIQLVLWDALGNFYLVDRSDVHDTSPAYASHFWALMKRASGETLRAFSGNGIKHERDGAALFDATIPDFNALSLTLTLSTPFKGEMEKGMVEGVVTDRLGTRRIEGEGFFQMYGE